jgi:hypothetical protein
MCSQSPKFASGLIESVVYGLLPFHDSLSNNMTFSDRLDWSETIFQHLYKVMEINNEKLQSGWLMSQYIFILQHPVAHHLLVNVT